MHALSLWCAEQQDLQLTDIPITQLRLDRKILSSHQIGFCKDVPEMRSTCHADISFRAHIFFIVVQHCGQRETRRNNPTSSVASGTEYGVLKYSLPLSRLKRRQKNRRGNETSRWGADLSARVRCCFWDFSFGFLIRRHGKPLSGSICYSRYGWTYRSYWTIWIFSQVLCDGLQRL
jgi:hypothetical protein